jgi:serine/threonine-protein kinase
MGPGTVDRPPGGGGAPDGGAAGGSGSGFAPALGRVGPYEILDLLGQGGMAAVYLARDRRDGRRVAVKVLARMRPSWVQRFSREFEAARRVQHENVVRVLESGEADGLAYYSMEQIEGVTAARYVLGLVADDPLPPPPPLEHKGPPEKVEPEHLRRTLDVASQLASAVGAIHEFGLVHRDLKPGNVLVTPSGVVKLVDFGVAKWLEEQTSFTQVGHVVGSYSYMSPEQITGSEVDHRADMYGMGVLVYELLTGAPPFRARRPQEYLWLHCTAQPEPLSRRLEGVPPALDALLLRMLAKEPADRPESMKSVQGELAGVRAEFEGMQAGATLLEIPVPAVGAGGRAPSAAGGPALDAQVVVEFESEADGPPLFADDDERTVRAADAELRALRRQSQKKESPTLRADASFSRLSASSTASIAAVQGPAPGPGSSLPAGPPLPPLGIEPDTSGLRSRPPELDSQRNTVPGPGAVPAPGTTGALGTQSNVALAALVTPRYVGRKAELDLLIEKLKDVRRTGVQAVLIEGEEGIGKTRLLHTFRGLAWVKGARVAIGRCHQMGGAFGAPFHDILLRLAGPGLARSHVDRVLGPDRELLARFFPALLSRGQDSAAVGLSGVVEEAEDLAGLFRAVGEVFRRVAADAPLVIGLEDVQWADDGTVRLVTSLLRRLSQPNPAQVLLAMSWRAEDLGGDASRAQLVPAIADLSNVHHVTLSPLSPENTKELIRSVTVDVTVTDDVVERLAAASRGNPRFAVEVSRSLVETGGMQQDPGTWDLPTTLLAAYRKRLESLSKPARDVARCIALLGGRPPLHIVATASGLDSRSFAGAITELERRRVVDLDHRTERDTVELHSEALRAAVLDLVSSTQARALHRRAAAAWLKAGRLNPDASAQAARHLFAAGEQRAAFPHALEAAYGAGEAHDYAAARRWMAQIGDPGDALTEVSQEALYRYHMLRFLLGFADGELDAANQAVGEAARLAAQPRDALNTGIACARLHTRTGNYLGAVQVCRRGLRESKAEQVFEMAVQFAIQGARAARRSGDNESALAWLQEADLLISRHPDLEHLAVRVAWTRSAALLELKREGEAEAEIQRAIELAVRTRQERAEAGLRTNLSVIWWRRGEIDEAVEEVERSMRIFGETGERDQVALNESNLAELRLTQGRVDEASRYAKSCWASFRRLRDRQGIIVSAASLLAVARAKQDAAEAEAVIDAVGDGPGAGQPLEMLWAVYWLERARWHRSRRQKSVAWHCIEQATRALGPQPAPFRKRDVDLVRAELHYDRGQYDRALPLLEMVLQGAEEEQHWPVLWWGRAVLAATQARLRLAGEMREPPERMARGHVPLALTTLWYRGEALLARAEEPAARRAWEEGRQVAKETGFVDWEGVFARGLGAG